MEIEMEKSMDFDAAQRISKNNIINEALDISKSPTVNMHTPITMFDSEVA
jgi:hypothetical protein